MDKNETRIEYTLCLDKPSGARVIVGRYTDRKDAITFADRIQAGIQTQPGSSLVLLCEVWTCTRTSENIGLAGARADEIPAEIKCGACKLREVRAGYSRCARCVENGRAVSR